MILYFYTLMFDGLLYAAFYGFVLAFAIGPVFFTLIETSITKGIKAAIFFDLGSLFSDVVFIVIAFYSTNKLLDKLKDDPALLVFGGLVLITFGSISYIRTSKSFIKIVREHYSVPIKTNHGGLFLKGFLLNFVNFAVLAGWIATIIIAKAVTTHKNGVILFLGTVMITLFITDLLKIILAKKLKNNLTPRFIIKTKKLVSVFIIIFGILLLIQGIFPNDIQERIEYVPKTTKGLE